MDANMEHNYDLLSERVEIAGRLVVAVSLLPISPANDIIRQEVVQIIKILRRSIEPKTNGPAKVISLPTQKK